VKCNQYKLGSCIVGRGSSYAKMMHPEKHKLRCRNGKHH